MFGYRSLGFGAFPNRGVEFSVANSARFVDDDSDHLIYTPPFVGNSFAWTLSWWFKIGVIDGRKHFFGQDDAYISINENSSTSHKINIYNVGRGAQGGSSVSGWYWETKALFRDPHAWTHLVVAFDSLQADAATPTAANALRVYANGVELTEFDPKHASGSLYNGLATNAGFHDIGSNEKHVIGKHPVNAAQYWDGYLAQFAYVNGRQLTPTSFGEFDTGGRWKPIDLTSTLTASTTAEAIVNVASSVSTSDATSYTFSSVALGTASSTRAAYVFISGQESTGTAGTITATINTGGGAVAMTKIRDINNGTEAHYQGSLFRADISSGTSADIVASITRTMSQLGAIVWTVTGDHHVFDLKVDTDTASDNTTSVSLTDVPANSVILAGRASAVGELHTWSSNLTENIDEIVEGTVRHTGASTATASGGDFTITCVPDSSGTDQRGRMFALVLSPTEGAGRNGFWLQFDSGTGAALGTNSRPDSLTFTPVAAAYTYNSTYLTIGSGTADNNGSPGVSGRLNNPFSGDFTFSTTATAIAGAIFGCFDADELGTFATGTDDGALDSMTKSWWYDDGGNGSGGAGSVGAGKIMYGNATQATSAIANGSVVTISRTDSTIKITDDGSAIHTFSQTHAGPVFIMIGHRNITSKSMNFDSITMTGTQGFTPV